MLVDIQDFDESFHADHELPQGSPVANLLQDFYQVTVGNEDGTYRVYTRQQ